MTVKTPKLFDICDVATEIIIYFMMIFSPWAFGTADPLSIWIMNTCGYLLGLCLLLKWVACRVTGYTPHRWESNVSEKRKRWLHRSNKTLAFLTVFLLAYVLCQAVNARADYLWGYGRFEWFENYIKWLPHSYDQGATWQALFKWSALACVFWTMRDWFGTKSIYERRKFKKNEERERVQPVLNRKLTRFLWVLSINAGVLALVGILQRLSGTDKLLWLVQPPLNKWNIQQFGPWAYRGMAAAWFNMVWPLTAGFVLLKFFNAGKSGERKTDDAFFVLAPLGFLLMVAPAISSSRLGLVVSLVLALGFAARYGIRLLRKTGRYRVPVTVGVCAVVLGGAAMIGEQMVDRLSKSTFSPRETGHESANSIVVTAGLELPERHDGRWLPVFALSPSDRVRRTSRSFETFLDPKGKLILSMSGAVAEQRSIWRIDHFFESYAGQSISLVVLVSEGSQPTVRVDDKQVELKAGQKSGEAKVSEIASAFLWYGEGRSSVWRGGSVASISLRLETPELAKGVEPPMITVNLKDAPVSRLGNSSGRPEIYRMALQSISDFPVFGVGLGGFPAISQLYRKGGDEIWQAYVHNDWLETAVSLGLVGGLFVLVGAGLVAFPRISASLSDPLHFGVALSILAILAHSNLDFPAQHYSAAFMMILIPSLVVNGQG